MCVLLFPTLARAAIERHLEQAGFAPVPADGPVPSPALLAQARMLVLPAHAYGGALAQAIREHGTALRLIQLVSSGYEELTRWGVPPGVAVANAGASWAPSVAEHTLAMMLGLARCIPALAAGHPGRSMRSLEGSGLLIVGYGQIGQEVARRAAAFGMVVTAVTRTVPRQPEEAVRIEPMARLPALVREADWIVISVPATPSTDRLFGPQLLGACKPGGVIVNVARGSVVDTEALTQALTSGRLGGAALDVTEPQPLPPGHPLRAMDNVILSPHAAIAGAQAGQERVAQVVLGNLQRLLRDQPPLHAVVP